MIESVSSRSVMCCRADNRESLGEALAGCEANPSPHLILVMVAIAPVKGVPGSPLLPTRL
jgi:hypothetical protein